jgi:3-methyladenine DNA glycosylase AlkD
MDVTQVINLLKQKATPGHLAGMQRFGINGATALGVNIPELRKLAKIINKDHNLAQQLLDTGLHEARIMAGMIEDPALVTPQQIDAWTNDFNSWDVCDQICGNCLTAHPMLLKKPLSLAPAPKNM